MFHSSHIHIPNRHRQRTALRTFFPSASFSPPDSKEPLRRGILLSSVAIVLLLVGCILTWLEFNEVFGGKISMAGPLLIAIALLMVLLSMRQFRLARKLSQNNNGTLQLESVSQQGGVTALVIDQEEGMGPTTVVVETWEGDELEDNRMRVNEDVAPPSYTDIAQLSCSSNCPSVISHDDRNEAPPTYEETCGECGLLSFSSETSLGQSSRCCSSQLETSPSPRGVSHQGFFQQEPHKCQHQHHHHHHYHHHHHNHCSNNNHCRPSSAQNNNSHTNSNGPASNNTSVNAASPFSSHTLSPNSALVIGARLRNVPTNGGSRKDDENSNNNPIDSANEGITFTASTANISSDETMALASPSVSVIGPTDSDVRSTVCCPSNKFYMPSGTGNSGNFPKPSQNANPNPNPSLNLSERPSRTFSTVPSYTCLLSESGEVSAQVYNTSSIISQLMPNKNSTGTDVNSGLASSSNRSQVNYVTISTGSGQTSFDSFLGTSGLSGPTRSHSYSSIANLRQGVPYPITFTGSSTNIATAYIVNATNDDKIANTTSRIPHSIMDSPNNRRRSEGSRPCQEQLASACASAPCGRCSDSNIATITTTKTANEPSSRGVMMLSSQSLSVDRASSPKMNRIIRSTPSPEKITQEPAAFASQGLAIRGRSFSGHEVLLLNTQDVQETI